jgi:hypothetical protein
MHLINKMIAVFTARMQVSSVNKYISSKLPSGWIVADRNQI